MKWKILMIAVLSLVVVGGGYGLARAHGGYTGSPMGYGHMTGDYANDEHPCWSDSDEASSVQVTREEAGNIVAYQLRRSNPRLKVGKILETEDGFEVQVVTRKGEALVDRLLVSKDTGDIYRIKE